MYEIFAQLLKERGIKTATVSRATGISMSTFTDWKMGRGTPKADKMKKIADYFGTDVQYLMTGERSEQYYLNPETAEIAQQIFDNRELRVLFDAARDARPDDLKTAYDVLLALKRKEGYSGDDPA